LTARTITASSGMIIMIILFVTTPHIYGQQQAEVTIKEWEVPTPNSAPHDIVVDERNGIVWFTEINANKIGKFDPTTEQFEEFDIPTPSSRPHGLAVDGNGDVWFTEMAGSKIGKLDVETGQVDEFPTPTLNSGPHTPIIGNGVI
jgi:virginiamycin B lyase